MIWFEALDRVFFTQYGLDTMEHPVPQNIASFEFHLIGDMTLKQFGYLASGLTIAYLTFVFLFPITSVIALPIIVSSSLFGAALAFLPILDRPLDHWLVAFFKSVYSPTQGKLKLENQFITNRLKVYLSSLQSIPAFQTPLPSPVKPLPPLPPAAKPVETIEAQKLAELSLYTHSLQNQLAQLQNQLAQAKPAPQPQNPNPFPTPIEPEPTPVLKVNIEKPKVTVVKPLIPTQTQLVLTSLPNVINGIASDSSGNYLEGVIVIIHNKEGVPVRALKTNKLGQFTGATPLPAGIYTITMERDDLKFDTLQVTLNDTVLGPLSIQPKTT